MMSNWWQHKVDADGRRLELFREVDRERLVNELPRTVATTANRWTLEMVTGAGGVAVAVLLMMNL